MKKLVAALAAFMLCISLTACAKDEPKEPQNDAGSQGDSQKDVNAGGTNDKGEADKAPAKDTEKEPAAKSDIPHFGISRQQGIDVVNEYLTEQGLSALDESTATETSADKLPTNTSCIEYNYNNISVCFYADANDKLTQVFYMINYNEASEESTDAFAGLTVHAMNLFSKDQAESSAVLEKLIPESGSDVTKVASSSYGFFTFIIKDGVYMFNVMPAN